MRELSFLLGFFFSLCSLFAQDSLLFAGPIAGANGPTWAVIWLQTTREVPVALRYWPEGDPTLAEQTDAVSPGPSRGFTARFELEGLKPATHYLMQVLINGTPVSLRYPAGFFTQPDSAIFDFTLAAGSCAYITDETAESDQGMFKFGGRYGIFDTLASFTPDYMLWLGDNVYYRDGDWNSKAGMHGRFRHSRALPGMQALLATGHHLAIWDDHDYGPNDSDRTYPLRDSSREVFTEVWANPHPVADSGIYTRLRIGDAEFFLLDDRSFRTPIEAADGPDKRFLGSVELDWLIQSLKASDATFKLIAIGTQVLSDTRFGEGYADDYAFEWQQLMDGLVKNRIEGVVFISGDKHYSEISRLDLEGFYPLFDLTFSPLTSQPTPVKLKNTRRTRKTFYNRRNFGLIHFEGRAEERRMTVQLFNSHGKLKWERHIWAKWLRVPD